ncbi:MAG: RNA polymerase-associated protein RapA [Pseudomonadota bacterium]
MPEQNDFVVGQRWLSNTEVDLGLGIVMGVDKRTVNIHFPAANQERTYATNQNALTRLLLEQGDEATHADGWSLVVESVVEQDDLVCYEGTRLDSGKTATLVEVALDHTLRIHQPQKRLFLAQLDHPRWFDTRFTCWQKQYELASSDVMGLIGARVELIPHQVHIAYQVGKRYAPRVLLADEVGLGKTIEAALILHQQILSGRAQRVLIVVPDTLVHQWLVELLRRVNLRFSIFDEERIQAVKESGENPFSQEQLILCSLDFIQQQENLEAAVAVPWDILVVDEAHHLQWSITHVSTEYQAIEKLSETAEGLLLLTATPDQLGHESHFARLKLLDPARFHDYNKYCAEESEYSHLAEIVNPLFETEQLTDMQLSRLTDIAPEYSAADLSSVESRQKLVRQLIDEHGTGRLMFRNRRSAISGFPERIVNPHPLTLPKEYEIALMGEQDVQLILHPERAAMLDDSWPSFDSRVDWLLAFLDGLSSDKKVLFICAYASSALQLSEYLRAKTSIRHTVFHEQMSIVERDRAAHFFASDEQGAQIMLCSEIGSEGRNFQFCHHLVLFDLPLNPDLLEQRIGRLDRIGQTRDVNIHIPYFKDQAQDVLYQWYHYGLSALVKTCQVGAKVAQSVGDELHAALLSPGDTENWQELIEETRLLRDKYVADVEAGRDRLLELNSSGGEQVEHVIDRIIGVENPVNMMRFMTHLLDSVGVQQEEKDDSIFVLRQGESMMFPIPGLSEEGTEVTYKRSTATRFEHVHYLSADSEIVTHCIDTVLTDVIGNSSICFVNEPTAPVGAYWLEFLAVLAPSSNPKWQLHRYLPVTPLRLCLDAKNQVVDIEFEQIFTVKPKMAAQLISALQTQLKQGISAGLDKALSQLEDTKQHALNSMNESLKDEHVRLTKLQQKNPSIRDEEISFIQEQRETLSAIITESVPYLDSLRVVINNPK